MTQSTHIYLVKPMIPQRSSESARKRKNGVAKKSKKKKNGVAKRSKKKKSAGKEMRKNE